MNKYVVTQLFIDQKIRSTDIGQVTRIVVANSSAEALGLYIELGNITMAGVGRTPNAVALSDITEIKAVDNG